MRQATDQLNQLAEHFPIPEHGRYVAEPARADETGVTYVPLKPPDTMLRAVTGISAAVAVAGLGALLLKKSKSSGSSTLSA